MDAIYFVMLIMANFLGWILTIGMLVFEKFEGYPIVLRVVLSFLGILLIVISCYGFVDTVKYKKH